MREWFARPLLAVVLAMAMTFLPCSAPAFAGPQDPAQNQQQNPPQYPAPQAQAPPSNPAPLAPPIPVALGMSKANYARGPRTFPNLLNAYRPIHVEQPVLVNSPRLEQMIHDGKLQLTLQDAVELALENSLDIAVQRYLPWFADTAILTAKTGGFGGGIGTNAAAVPFSTASLPFINFDPTVTQGIQIDSRSTPFNNPFLAGTGTGANTLIALKSHSSIFNTTFNQGFATGTSVQVAWDNTRSSSTSAANVFNPSISSTLSVGFQQNLLQGCCWKVNHRNIYIAQNNRKITEWAFTQQAITTVTNTITVYWELVYARENVRVQQDAVTVAEKLYNDNRKQLEIGTMAPLDVTRAESELATDRGNLIVSQTAQLQQEQNLKNLISKDPLAPNMVNLEIVPTELPQRPGAVESPTFEDAVREAFAKRPDLQEQVYNLKNTQIDVEATANALRPLLTLTGQFSSLGLAGNSTISGLPTLGANAREPVVDANGNPVLVNGAPIFLPQFTAPIVGVNQQGLTSAQNQVFRAKFPEFFVGLNLTVPLRNRSAQATSERAILSQRQLVTQVQSLKNAALLDVRNNYIALQQDRARVEAATKARDLQQQTFEAEQKKYQLGASTVYLVIQTQRDFIAAQGTELRALADLVEAKAKYEQAVGRTLEVNRVTIADAKTGEVERDTLIPGTLHGKVVGTDEIWSKPTQK